MRHLFQFWHRLVERTDEATQVLLSLDYVGTVTPVKGIYGMPRSLPTFAGDDVTDEDRLTVLHGIGGISVFIGENNAYKRRRLLPSSLGQLYHWSGKLLQGR